jgi:hypothetical protein
VTQQVQKAIQFVATFDCRDSVSTTLVLIKVDAFKALREFCDVAFVLNLIPIALQPFYSCNNAQ